MPTAATLGSFITNNVFATLADDAGATTTAARHDTTTTTTARHDTMVQNSSSRASGRAQRRQKVADMRRHLKSVQQKNEADDSKAMDEATKLNKIATTTDAGTTSRLGTIIPAAVDDA